MCDGLSWVFLAAAFAAAFVGSYELALALAFGAFVCIVAAQIIDSVADHRHHKEGV